MAEKLHSNTAIHLQTVYSEGMEDNFGQERITSEFEHNGKSSSLKWNSLSKNGNLTLQRTASQQWTTSPLNYKDNVTL